MKMRTTTIEKLKELQRNPRNIRNICILAHVDHGKTTLADTLVASNGIISQRMAGKLRYLDSREDEQLRGITMKSSAISLRYQQDEKEYLVNLIDSPGHIDFSSEVSTAVRLCDGAVVVVDVVEGVCPQTQAVLRQAWLENIKPVLLLNKIDRLILELKLTPLEVYLHLTQLLEQVNAVTGELFTSEVLEKTSAKITENEEEKKSSDNDQVYDWSSGLEHVDDSTLYFSPDQGNVIFASAVDGWGFGVDHFADIFGKKLGINSEVLKKTLWGDFYLDSKTKRIKKGAQSKAKKPLFVQFVLENLWSVYETVCIRRDKLQIEKIINSLGLKVAPRDLRHTDPKVQLQAICSQWLPLSKAVLAMVVNKLPSPLDMTDERAQKLMCSSSRRFDSLPPQTQLLKNEFLLCSSDASAPVIVFVSKMFVMDKKSLPENRQRPLTQEEIAERREQAKQRLAAKLLESETNVSTAAETGNTQTITQSNLVATPNKASSERDDSNDQVFIAFARVFSGSLRKNQKLYVLGPKHDPAKALKEVERGVDVTAATKLADLSGSRHMTSFTVDQLYLFMGRELEQLDEVPAGNVLGIGRMEDHILKSATVSSTIACPAFTDMYMEASPIVRVAVEPNNAGDMGKLMAGMRLLNQADPSVEILIQETGEHVIIAAGEVHLEKCLDDLRERYARVEINVSKATVPFRETIIPPPKTDMVNESIQDQRQVVKAKTDTETEQNGEEDEDERVLEVGLVEVKTANRMGCVQIRALPLPTAVTELLHSHASLIKTLDSLNSNRIATGKNELETASELNEETISSIKKLKESLKEAFAEAGELWVDAVDQIWAFGPKRTGPNLLLNRFSNGNRSTVWNCVEIIGSGRVERQWQFDSIVSGFQLATLCGPLCEEPMMGVCFIVEHCEIQDKDATDTEISTSIKENNKDDLPDIENLNIKLNGESSNTTIRETDNENTKLSQQTISKSATYGPLSGQLMSSVKDGCRRAFQSQPQRLMVAMYTCNIQATAEVLGRMYAVLGKRNGRILEEDMKEGSNLFNITAVLPVVESFGFAEEFRKRTSGLASPQLKFSHWEVLDIDPFWVPTTEEEYMHFGEKADSDNVARKYMNNVRRRKGLKVDEKIVEFAEKQRTLSKNK